MSISYYRAKRRRAAFGCVFRILVVLALAVVAVTGIVDHRLGPVGPLLAGCRQRAVSAYPPLGKLVVGRPPRPPAAPQTPPATEDAVPIAGLQEETPPAPQPDVDEAAVGTLTEPTVVEAVADKPVTVTVNDEAVGDSLEAGGANVARLVRPGRNTLRVRWTGPVNYASITVRHGGRSGAAADEKDAGPGFYEGGARDAVADVYLIALETRQPGEINLAFLLPDPSDPASPVPASAADDRAEATLLDGAATGGTPVSVFLNGKSVGDFQARRALDVSAAVRAAGPENTLRVVWRRPVGHGEVRVLRRAAPDAPLSVLARIRLDPTRAARPGETTVTFRLPTTAAR